MITTVTDCPIHDFLSKGIQPEIVFDKKPGDKWIVPAKPLRFDGEAPEFTLVETGDLVRVPLFAYRTTDKQLHTLAGFTMELGVRAVLATPMKPARMHLVLGNPVLDLASQNIEAYRVHLGLAFLIRS
jgi:hypothetical protein